MTDSQPAVNHHMAHQLAILIVNLTSFYDNHEHREILTEALALLVSSFETGGTHHFVASCYL